MVHADVLASTSLPITAGLTQSTFQPCELGSRSAPCAGAPCLVFDTAFLLRLFRVCMNEYLPWGYAVYSIQCADRPFGRVAWSNRLCLSA